MCSSDLPSSGRGGRPGHAGAAAAMPVLVTVTNDSDPARGAGALASRLVIMTASPSRRRRRAGTVVTRDVRPGRRRRQSRSPASGNFAPRLSIHILPPRWPLHDPRAFVSFRGPSSWADLEVGAWALRLAVPGAARARAARSNGQSAGHGPVLARAGRMLLGKDCGGPVSLSRRGKPGLGRLVRNG